MSIKSLKSLWVAVFSLGLILNSNVALAQDEHGTEEHVVTDDHAQGEKQGFDANKVIFDHVLDAHEFHFLDYEGADGKHHAVSIPLPVIMYSTSRGFSVFMSSAFHHGEVEVDGYRLVDGKILPVNESEKVYDLSLTRNVVQMIFALAVLVFLMVNIAKKYKQGIGTSKAPSGFQNAVEPVITFIRDEVAKPNLGNKYEKYLPFLLTVFFFILINAIFGLVPGAANVTGNIAFTLVLGVISFIIITLSGNKHYWKHIFNPPVPGFVWPIMVIVEFLSVFTKPFALIIRLFANMLAGHIIIICLISLIFIFGGLTKAAGWGFAPVSVAFATFIYLIEILVAFIQAFIFANLTAVFIGQAIEETHHEGDHHPKQPAGTTTAAYDDPVII